MLGFGVSEITIYSDGTSYPGTPCDAFPANLTSFTASKEIWKRWHWTYSFDGFSGRISQQCPTSRHDVDVYIGDKLVARSDKKFVSLVSEMFINDCAGNKLATVRTGDAFETIVNSNKIFVSMEVRDTSDTVVGYTSGTHFFSDDIDILDKSGDRIANMKRNTLSTSWKWIVEVYQPSKLAGQPVVLCAIAGSKAFEGDSTDMCNDYFWAIAYIFLTVGILVVVMLGCFIYTYCKKGDSSV